MKNDRNGRHPLFWQEGRMLNAVRPLFFLGLALLILGVCIASIANAWGLQGALRNSTESYATDVSTQVASDIDFRLAKVTQDLESLVDSLLRISRLPTQLEFLTRKASLYSFDTLALIDLDGNAFYLDGSQADLSGDPGVQAALGGQAGISFSGSQSILYTVPIVQDGTVVGALGGLRSKENMQRLIRTQAFDGQGLSCILDQDGNVIVSPTNLDPFLVLDDLFVKNSDSALVHSIEQMRQDMRDQKDGTLTFTSSNGSRVLLVYNALPTYDWVLLTLVSADLLVAESEKYVLQTFVITGVTILLFTAALVVILVIYRRHRRQLEHIAFVDPVTGGRNSARFRLECAALLQAAAPGRYTIVALNMKGFRLINENFGSQAGNDILRHTLRQLESALKPGELATRGAADSFYLCLHESQPDAIQVRLDGMIQRINAFNEHRSSPYYLTFTQGAYVVDDPGLEVTVMQDRANTARKNTQALHGSQCVFYDAATTQRLQQEKELTDLLHESLRNHDFQVYLQPKIRLADGTVGGAEALVRWAHPDKGVISPGDFIPLFERDGSICELDLYVFEQVCAMLGRWQRHGRPLCIVSVNLSRQHFHDPAFLSRFEAIRARYKVPPQWLELEVTESIMFHRVQFAQVKAAIAQMHALGYTCSLDDFGSGYSSLGLLKAFDVDVIKLDRSFFTGQNCSVPTMWWKPSSAWQKN